MHWRIDEWARDLRQAARALRRTAGFTVVAAGTLGLAIGCNAGMFGVIDNVLLNPLPYAHVDRLVHIAMSAPGTDLPPELGLSSEFLIQYREQSRLLEDLSTYNRFTSTLRTADRVERIRMSMPTSTMFNTLGAKPLIGRLPLAEDEERTVVLSYGLWQSWFGGEREVIGRDIDVSGAKRTVIGVMGPEFKFPDDGVQLWISSVIKNEGIVPGRFGGPALVGRMKPGVTTAQLADELDALARQLPERFGGPASYARVIEKHRAVVRPLEEQMLGSVTRPLWVLTAALTVVLLIACANVANLFLVRAEARQRDLAVRRAIGAGRGQLVRLQMAEALVVAALASLIALGLAALILPLIRLAAPPNIPRLDSVSLNLATVLYTVGAALVSALVCGLVPALRASNPDLNRLRDGGRGSTHRRHWARDILVVAQTGLALVLLIASGLLVRSFGKLSQVDPGYRTKDLFTFQIAPERPSLKDGPTFARFDLEFIERLKKLPGVVSVGLVENIPLDEGTGSMRVYAEETGSEENASLVHRTYTAGDYFKTMGIPLLQGRLLGDDDQSSMEGNALISRAVATLLWPGEDPVGKRFKRPEDKTWSTVVGVVGDVMQDSFRDTPQALVYFPLVGPTPESWAISSPAYVLKTARAETIAPDVRALAQEVAPEAPMYRVYTLAGLARGSMVDLSFTMLTLGIASALALVLGAVGLYGVLSYVVAERTREIGLRMALGAQAEQVRRMVVRQGARVVSVGLVLGMIVALASTRALGSLLFGVEAMDVGTFVGMAAAMFAVGLLASYVPARRASNVDPTVSLRGE